MLKIKKTHIEVATFTFWLAISSGHDVVMNKSSSRFPADFRFGVSTSAYQIEGGWNEDGKGMSIWDYLTHTDPGFIEDKTNADIAADSYHLYKRDVEMLRELGVKSYKFSISWPRILPNGLSSYVNFKGIAYYNNLINELLANDIEPYVTMYHWDLPQYLQEKGGILNDDFPQWFGDYARIVFQHFGDRVKYWMTINEPLVQCMQSYEANEFAPKIHLPGRGFYECNRNLLLAHARAYHLYNDEFRLAQKGKVSIILNLEWPVASTNSSDDKEAVLDYFAFRFGMAADPIFSKKGNYPQRVIDRVALMSTKQGLNSSRLRALTVEEVKYIRGTADYLPLNHYSSKKVYSKYSLFDKNEPPSLWADESFGTYKDPSWQRTTTNPVLWANAQGFYDFMLYVRDTYDNPEIYIVENGFISDDSHDLNDDDRVKSMRDYLSALQSALETGVNVKGYSAWSLMDAFEWPGGFSKRYGLYNVDINDPGRRRTARKSALVYKEIVRSGIIDYDYNPDPMAARSGASKIARNMLIGLAITITVLIL